MGLKNNLNNPLVSIVLNCYNGEKFLKEAIDSIYNQSYVNWEIIFWDNQSEDNSSLIAKKYDDRLKYFKSKKKTSLGEARNNAIKKSNGKYIAFIDCDDIWCDKNKIYNQVKILESNPEIALDYGSIEEIFENGMHFRYVINKYDTGFIFGKLLNQFDISIITTMIRKSILQELSLNFDPNIKASEEYCLFMQIASKYKISVTKKIYSKYRVSMNSLTSKSLNILGYERRYTLNLIIENNNLIYSEFQKEFSEAFARANYYDARWYIFNNQKIDAFLMLKKNWTISYKYVILSIVALLSKTIWNKIHLIKRNRI